MVAIPSAKQPLSGQPQKDELGIVGLALACQRHGWNRIVASLSGMRVAYEFGSNPNLALRKLVQSLQLYLARFNAAEIVLQLPAGSQELNRVYW
jgi:hypothetical protein